MKSSIHDPQNSPLQRLEAGGAGPGFQPPKFELTAGTQNAQGDGAPSPKEQATKTMEDQGGKLENMEEGEQEVVGKLSQALEGQEGDIMTKETMPLAQSALGGVQTKTFKYGGVKFEVVDVGGDWQSDARRLLDMAIVLLRIYDTHDYNKQPAKKVVHFYFGDYKAMAAYTKAHTELPYQEWANMFKVTNFGGGQYTYPDPTNPGTMAWGSAKMWGLSFVRNYFDPRKEFTEDMQNSHNAFFIDASQQDRYGSGKNDIDYKKALDLALTIVHEATHTLRKDGGHASPSDHLMHDGGPRYYLEAECVIIDPKTNKEVGFDHAKYRKMVIEVLEKFAKRY